MFRGLLYAGKLFIGKLWGRSQIPQPEPVILARFKVKQDDFREILTWLLRLGFDVNSNLFISDLRSATRFRFELR